MTRMTNWMRALVSGRPGYVALLTPILILLSTAASAGAQELDARSLTWSADDPALEWLPCPEFMPEGCGLAVLNGDPAERNADVFFRLPPHSTAPHHLHTSAERMILVSGEMELDYEGQDPFVLYPGTYIYGPPGLPHSGTCRSDDPCVLFIAFEEPVDAMLADSR